MAIGAILIAVLALIASQAGPVPTDPGFANYSGDGNATASAGPFISAEGIPAPSSTPPGTAAQQDSQEADSPQILTKTYHWTYGNDRWVSTMTIADESVRYYRDRPHNRERDYAQYALSDYDRAYLRGIVATFQDAGKRQGYSEYDTIMNIVSFVQSLPYTTDNVTTGYDEYPRYPLETLADGGGDCEDSAILTAALLREMGYGAVLIEVDNHMAVGVQCSGRISGTYYDYQGARYYYLETTGTGWSLGEMPESYRESGKVTIYPMRQVPRMEIAFSADVLRYNSTYVYYRVHCTIANIGSGTAVQPKMYIAALSLREEGEAVWLPDHTIDLDDYPEGATGWAEAVVRIPRNEVSGIVCRLSGENFATAEVRSGSFTA